MTLKLKFLITFAIVSTIFANAKSVYIRTNQLGYLEDDIKVAVAMFPIENNNISKNSFSLINLYSQTGHLFRLHLLRKAFRFSKPLLLF